MGPASRWLFHAVVQFVAQAAMHAQASRAIRLAGTVAALLLAANASGEEPYAEAPPERVQDTPMETMIREIQDDAERTSSYTGIERIGDAVLEALRDTPRERFVLPRSRSLAYANHPLPIGYGQTISQPFIVAVMTEFLAVAEQHRVLEIGTGSGYQAAVLAHLAAEVYTVEIVPELAETASERLKTMGYDNVQVRAGDGWQGWPEHAPFDGIIVTAVGEVIPPALIEQLAPDGRLVMPVGRSDGFQELVVYSKRSGSTQTLFPVRFVPLTGGP